MTYHYLSHQDSVERITWVFGNLIVDLARKDLRLSEGVRSELATFLKKLELREPTKLP